jgi:hypothetical protein
VHRGEIVDRDGLVYTAGELGFLEVSDVLRGLLEDGVKLLEAVEKIPRRTFCQPRPRQGSRLEEQLSDPR